jgi:hypothetical protein
MAAMLRSGRGAYVQVFARLPTATRDTSRGGEQERPRIASRGDAAVTQLPPLLDRHGRGDAAFDDAHCVLAA